MNDLTPDELYVLACALDRQREHMYETGPEWTHEEHYAVGRLIGRMTTELDQREDRCACLHIRAVHGAAYCGMCACDG